MPINASWAHLCLGVACYETNDLVAAAAHFREVLGRRDSAHAWAVSDAALGLALVQQASGNPREATRVIEQTILTLERIAHPDWLVQAESLRARLALMQNDLVVPLRWLNTSGSPALVNRSYRVEAPPLTRLRVMAARGYPLAWEETIDLAEALRAAPEIRFDRRLALRTMLLEATARSARGEDDIVQELFDEVLALAAPRGLIRLFIDEGQHVLNLLSRVKVSEAASGFVAEVLAAAGVPAPVAAGPRGIPGPAPFVAAPVQDALTPREMQVLERLQRHQSNKEISAELGISPMTVKRHTINLYNKLGVQSRREAVRAGLSLGLLTR